LSNAKYPNHEQYAKFGFEVLGLVQWRRREEVIGKEVIDGEAKKLGVTKDLAWSNNGQLALIVEIGDEEESFLSFDEIEKIGDVVFVKAKSGMEKVPMISCPICKHRNPVEAKFCAKCGRTLEAKEEKEKKDKKT
jgi:sporulation protein YlmC with PRC-barrel domain